MLSILLCTCWPSLECLLWKNYSEPLPMLKSGFCFSSVQSLSCVQLLETPWTAACQASLSFTNLSWSLLKFMSVESVMPSNHLILSHPLLLLPSVFTSIRVFFNELVLHIRWPKYWSFSFSFLHIRKKATEPPNYQTQMLG